MTLKDYILAIVTGFLTGLFLQPTLSALGVRLCLGPEACEPLSSLIYIIPVLWVLGILLGQILSRWIPFMGQFAKYVAAGFLSAAIDFGVLNYVLGIFGATAGIAYAVAKSASYIAGNINAFLWNKFWTFKKPEVGLTAPNENVTEIGKQYGKFLTVSVIGFVLNVGISSFMASVVGPQFGFSEQAWANIAAVAGAALVIVWNFAGYKFFVFTKK